MENPSSLEEVELLDTNRTKIRLGELWRNQPVVIAWLRHYG